MIPSPLPSLALLDPPLPFPLSLSMSASFEVGPCGVGSLPLVSAPSWLGSLPISVKLSLSSLVSGVPSVVLPPLLSLPPFGLDPSLVKPS
jgi:hypothetical protein